MQSSPFEARYQQLISDLAVGHPFVISSVISVLTFDRFECEVMGPKYLTYFSFDNCFLFAVLLSLFYDWKFYLTS